MTRKQAYSLVEILISLVLLLIGVMGLAVAFQRSIYQTNSSRNDTQAMMLAMGILDELSTYDFQDVEAQIPNIQDNFYANYQGEFVAPGAADEFYVPEIIVLNSSFNTIDLEVRINWIGWDTEQREGGFGRGTSTSAFTINTTITQQYGDDFLSGGFGAVGP